MRPLWAGAAKMIPIQQVTPPVPPSSDMSVIDTFMNTFSNYIDSGFGLLGSEVDFLVATLIVIDLVLAGVFWAISSDGTIMARFLKKVLYIGVFAYIIGNFAFLATVIFDSFSGLGLQATGTSLTPADLMRPGFIASTGFDAASPILDTIKDLTGPVKFFVNIVLIAILFLAWLITIFAFFFLSIQLFVTIIEFKLTTLAGFVLVPFALWNKTSFLAERVLGRVSADDVVKPGTDEVIVSAGELIDERKSDAVEAAGVTAFVVPGISSALGCAASAGIPLTHRDHAQAVTFVTGHAKAGGVPDLDWPSLARRGQTVTVYMGVGTAGLNWDAVFDGTLLLVCWDTYYANNFHALSTTISATPIPGALWLFATGLAALAGLKRKSTP